MERAKIALETVLPYVGHFSEFALEVISLYFNIPPEE